MVGPAFTATGVSDLYQTQAFVWIVIKINISINTYKYGYKSINIAINPPKLVARLAKLPGLLLPRDSQPY